MSVYLKTFSWDDVLTYYQENYLDVMYFQQVRSKGTTLEKLRFPHLPIHMNGLNTLKKQKNKYAR